MGLRRRAAARHPAGLGARRPGRLEDLGAAARPDRLVRHPRHRLALLPGVRDEPRPRPRAGGHARRARALGGGRLDRRPRHLGDAADELLRATQAGGARRRPDGRANVGCAQGRAVAGTDERPPKRGSQRAAGSRSLSSARSGRRWPRAAAACCTRPPAPARPTPSGSARSPAPPASACRRGGASAPPLGVLWLTPMRALAADSARAITRAARRARPRRWSVGIRTGDTALGRAREAGPPLPDRARDHARIAQPDADARGRAGRARRRPHRHRRRVARADGQQARRPGAAGARAAAALEPGPRRLGPVGDARQPRRGDAGAARRRATARSVRGRIDKNLVIDTLLPVNPGRFSWGGHLGKQMQQPVVEEIERSATTLVFVNMRSQAEAWYQLILDARPDWAGRRRAAPRLARQGGARLGRARPEGRAAEGGGRDLVARPRRRLPAGRARAADRLGQGRRAPAAARRPQRPRARPRQPDHARADQHARAGRGGRGAARGAGRAASRSARPTTSRSTCWSSTW